MANRRQYSGNAPATVLQTTMTAVSPAAGGTINVSAGTGANYPDGSVGNFFIVIDRGLSTEEKLLISSRTNDTLTIGARGADNTTAASHTAGSAVLEHVVTKTDLDEANAHITVTSQDDHTQYLNVARHDVTARHGTSVLDTAALTALMIPTGTMWMTANAAAPSGWLLCDGSAVSRTGGNANLFAAIGTTYGAGDGSTTFNLPDMRGRVPVGVGTGTGGGASGTGLPTGGVALTARARGGWTGEETHALSVAELASHGHSHSHGGTGTDATATTPSADATGETGHNHGHNHQTTSNSDLPALVAVGGTTGLTGTSPALQGTSDSGHTVHTSSDSTGSTGHNHNHTHGAHSHSHGHTIATDATTAGSGTAHNTIQPQMCVNFMIKL